MKVGITVELLLDEMFIRDDRVVLVDVDTHTEVKLSFEDALVLLSFLSDSQQDIQACYDAESVRNHTKASRQSPHY